VFSVSQIPLEQVILKNGLLSQEAGALVTFEGFVRCHNEGKEVVTLEYDVFDSLAIKEGNCVLTEAKEKFSILDAKCFHRKGKLAIGEMAVWVGVSAGHRDEAFKACKYIIDEIKLRLPIWKKEYYANGDSGWIGCGKTAGEPNKEADKIDATALSQNEIEFYSRQINLPQVGADGQKKLKSAKVLAVGAGGLGSPALTYLAASGVGTLGICEFDTLEASNLHRQPIYAHADIGISKAHLAAKELKTLNPFIHLRIHNEKLTAANVRNIVQEYDILLDCTDNFPVKFLLSDAAVLLKIPLVQASVYQFEGQLKVYQPKEGASCLRCLWPKIPEAGCTGNCAMAGVLGVVPGVFGILQAAEAVKMILGLPTLSSNEILIFDFLSYRMKTLKQTADPACPVCGTDPTIIDFRPENYIEADTAALDIKEFSPGELTAYEIIDVREESERRAKPVNFDSCISIATSVFEKTSHPFTKDKKYLLFCEKGIRSGRLVRDLRSRGILQSFSILNGADGLKACLKKNAFTKVKVLA